MKCENCNSKESYIKEYKKEFTVKGKKIEEKITTRFCKNCNSPIYDEKLDNDALKKVLNKYSKIYGIEPKKIKEFRKKFNLSQELFSKIIGCAKKTLISYENGTSIPNDTYLIILKTLIENEETIKPIIEANKIQFSDKEYDKIKNNIYSNIKDDNTELTIYNGFANHSYEKIKDVVSYLANGGIHKTKLLKELFYVDFKCYKEYCYSMTGMEYAKINYGPVPNDFELLLKKLENDNIIEIENKIHNNYEENIIKLVNKEKINNLDKKEIEILREVTNYFKDFNVRKIVDFSHKEKGFIETKKRNIISYEYAFDLQI